MLAKKIEIQNQNSINSKIHFPLQILPPLSDPFLKLNSICPYFTMFPIKFPFEMLSKAKSNEWVLDPFCGRGTTNYAARLRGLPSIGIDSNPVAVAVASSKMVDVKPSEIIALCKEILEINKKPKEIPVGEFWNLCYDSNTLRQLCCLREELLIDCSTDERIALRSSLLGILHGPLMKTTRSYLSNQMPRTYATKPNSAINFWRKRNMEPPKTKLIEVLQKKIVGAFSVLPPKTSGFILNWDSREPFTNFFNQKISWIITSPPYFGMRTYYSDQWLRNWFMGGESDVNYSQPQQISHYSEKKFVEDLGSVWKNCAEVCCKKANLVIRFGILPSVGYDPESLILKSLNNSSCEWEITNIKSAGIAPKGSRQSDQFMQKNGAALDEIDVSAILKE